MHTSWVLTRSASATRWILCASPGLTAAIALAAACAALWILALAPPRQHEVLFVSLFMVSSAIAVLSLAAQRRIADLECSEQRLRSILEVTSELVWEVDLAGTFTYLEGRVKQFSGYEPEELLGRPFVEFLHEDELTRLGNLFLSRLGSPAPERGVEVTWHRKDGAIRYIHCDALPLWDLHRNLRGFRGVVRDVTESKRARQQAEALAFQAKESAEAASRAKTEFLANISHEIRTPMTAILGFTDVLVSSLAKPEDVEVASIIKGNAEQLLSLLDDILDLSKIEAGRMLSERMPCSPRAVVEDVVSLIRVRAESKGLSLDVDLRGPIPETIATDPGKLRQILINLVGNAVKFTERGGVQVVAGMGGASQEGPWLDIQVIDTGIGITPEQLARLFRPFTQADATMTRRFGGTGLGLTISKRLAAMLGGDITVESTPGQGSTFRFSLAVRSAADSACSGGSTQVRTAPCSPPTQPKSLQCRILLVEDGPDNQRLIAFLLRKAGAEVKIVEDGCAAVAAVLETLPGHGGEGREAQAFDVILMDIQMPVMDGYEATRRIRAAGYQDPIIALTAHAMNEDRQKCLDAGCNDYLTKPFDTKSLLPLVDRYAGSHRHSSQPVTGT
jgi:PAS domain S-box-containing protein